VSVTDDNNCQQVYIDSISQPAELTSSFSITNATCNDDEDGTIKITTTGGTAPYAYIWSTGSTSDSLSGLEVGDYFVTITDDNDCEYNELVSVDFDHESPTIPLGDSAKLCTGFQIILNAGNSGMNFSWSTGDVSQTILVGSGGPYTVTVTDTTGCSTTHTVEVKEHLCVGIDETRFAEAWHVYPNPSRGVMTLELETAPTSNLTLQVIGMDGRTMKNFVLSQQITALDLGSLSSGVYFLRMLTPEKVYSKRIVIE
jgi:hypothetical protein